MPAPSADFIARIALARAPASASSASATSACRSRCSSREDGFRVTGFDIDAAKVDTLNRGESYIHRIEPEHIRAAQAAGFRATTDFADVARLDAILICVPTPLHPDHTPDMSFVVATIEPSRPTSRPASSSCSKAPPTPAPPKRSSSPPSSAHGNRVLRTAPADAQPGARRASSSPSRPSAKTPATLTTPRRDIPKVVGGVDPAATAAACALYGAIFDRTVPMSAPPPRPR